MSKLQDNGNPIHAMGFLATYSGNLEFYLVEELERIKQSNLVVVDPRAKTLGGKIAELKKFSAYLSANQPLNPVYPDEAAELVAIIIGLEDFTRDNRNPLIHGSIVSPYNGSNVFELTDQGVKRTITSADIYGAADYARELHGAVMRIRFILAHHLRDLSNACAVAATP